ncbi:MCE family protein [Segetibacter sp. 3557_3]|uniref:MlaD family protein n=1 Tax=Segetibacter sp. 3557_3 TaxID=2547429 RepID=UPI001058B108|nr:MlaD family protein [Segetibacter sp. 3557_3]TDH21431.1 MCE family protein [Segetibacter sp. 3557_3]
MKAAQTKRAAIVGIFIFLGIAILIVTILTLGGQKKTFRNSITVRAVFDDVQGLLKGNNVWFSGVKIGTVKRISFTGTSQVEVDLTIEEKSVEYIRKNARAKISSESFIGSKIIEIIGGTPQAGAVDDGDILAVEKTLGTEEMMGTFQANNRNLLDITTDLKAVSKRLNNGEGTIGKLLSDDQLATQLSTVMATLRRASANTERLTTSIANYTAQLNNKQSFANQLVNDTIIFSQLRSTARELDEISKTANDVVVNLKQTSSDINTGVNNSKSPVGMLLKDEAAAKDIRVILNNLNSGTQKLDENLEALQHNFLLRGFFRKKAKRDAKAQRDTLIIAPAE